MLIFGYFLMPLLNRVQSKAKHRTSRSCGADDVNAVSCVINNTFTRLAAAKTTTMR